MVSKFPLDYMHLILLGVVRKLLYIWIAGPLQFRLQGHQVALISQKMVEFKHYTPMEFSRKPRALEEFKYWKATEFRSLLLYFSVCAFRDVLPQRLYDSYLMLVCGMRILLHPLLSDMYHEYAGTLLHNFVADCIQLYGKKVATYNMHATTHLAKEAAMYSLETISAFPFENHLYQIKRMLRKPGSTLVQIISRIQERKLFGRKKEKEPRYKFIRPHTDGPLGNNCNDCFQYDSVRFEGVTFSRNERDSCVKFEDSIGLIRNVLRKNDEGFCVLSLFRKNADYFTYPVASSFVGIHAVETLTGNVTVAPVDECTKCVLMPLRNDAFVAVQLCSAATL